MQKPRWQCSPFPLQNDLEWVSGSIAALSFVDRLRGLVATGQVQASLTAGKVYKTEDGGNTWRVVLDDGSDCEQIVHVDARRAFLSCVTRPDIFQFPDTVVYGTEDGGDSWQRVAFVKNGTFAMKVRFGIDPDGGVYLYRYGERNSGFFRAKLGERK
jgi:photosystem II stability/assembly factor-like uncharacterized protein